MSTEELPALPWGRPPNQAQPVDLPAQLQLKTGTARIEVFWVLEIGDNDESEDESEDVEKASKHGKVVRYPNLLISALMQWWGATLVQRLEGSADGEGRPLYLLKYDADVDAGYEEEERRVSFLDEHELYDLDLGDTVSWRMQGDTWDDLESDTYWVKGERADGEKELLVDKAKWEQHLDKLERLRGIKFEDTVMSLLNEMCPKEVHHIVAERLRRGIDVLREEIKAVEEDSLTRDCVVRCPEVLKAIERAKKRLKEDGMM